MKQLVDGGIFINNLRRMTATTYTRTGIEVPRVVSIFRTLSDESSMMRWLIWDLRCEERGRYLNIRVTQIAQVRCSNAKCKHVKNNIKIVNAASTDEQVRYIDKFVIRSL